MVEQRNRCILLHTQGNTNHDIVYNFSHNFATQVAAQFQLEAIVTVAITLHVYYCIDTSKECSSEETLQSITAKDYSTWTHSLKLFYRVL